MTANDLQFQEGNPGAVKHGNFINYYKFHSPEDRLSLLPLHLWKEITAKKLVLLDIGCNAGDLTNAVHDILRDTTGIPCKTLGIDIDPILITRANENKKCENIEYHTVNFMIENERFNTITGFLNKAGCDKFDVTFCFSITMWIHLNNGDDGLKDFLGNVCKISKQVLIEPQPWKCYKSALKRFKSKSEVFPKFRTLQYKENVETYINDVMLSFDFEKIWESLENSWGRKLICYQAR